MFSKKRKDINENRKFQIECNKQYLVFFLWVSKYFFQIIQTPLTTNY